VRRPDPPYTENLVVEIDGRQFQFRVDPEGNPVGELTVAGKIAWARYQDERRREAVEKERDDNGS
jgi:sRNA-binding protein